jgi:4-hydroxyphenylpyruvate dioxygenase
MSLSSATTSLSTSPIDGYAMTVSTPATSIHGDLDHPSFSIASLSLGTNVHHNLPTKIRTASRLGYDAIEIFIPDFDAFVHEVGVGHHAEMFTEEDWLQVHATKDLELLCAKTIGRYCQEYGLVISCFQPFREFENFAGASRMAKTKMGSLPPRLQVALDRAESYLRLMPALQCDLLLVCSNLLPYDPITERYTERDYLDDQVVAFTELGQLASTYGVKIGHEALAWGTVVNRWEQVWEVVDRVDLPNVGVILDSFNQL